MLRIIDTFFRAVATAIFRHPVKTSILFLILIGAALATMPKLKSDGRIEAFMHDDDPALIAYYEMRRSFGQDNRIVVTVNAPDLFSREFLETFAAFHREIARDVPYIAEIFSPYNIPFIEFENGGFYLEELVRNMLARDQDPRVMRDRIVETPLYRNFIISKDGKTAAIIIEPYRFAPHALDCVARPEDGFACDEDVGAADEERQLLGAVQYAEMAQAVNAIAARYQNADSFDIHIAGAPIVSTEIVRLMSQDMPRFTMLCFGIAVVVIMVMYRSVLVALAALFAFLPSVFFVFALMALTDNPLTPPTQLLIPLLLVGSLCSFIHFISALLRGHRQTGNKEDAISFALTRCHAPILFSALTTAAGLIGFTFSSLAPIAVLGLFGALGILVAYLNAMLSAVIVFRILREKFFARRYENYPGIVRRMTAASLFAARNPRTVLAVTVGVVILAVGGIRHLEYSHNSLLWLPEDNTVRQSTDFIDGQFNGTVNLEVVIHPKDGRDFRDEELLSRIDAAADEAHGATPIPIGRDTSIIDFIKETNQALHDGDPAAHEVPSQEKIWDQILLLEGEGNDDTKRYVSIDYSSGRVSFLTPWLEAREYTGFINTVQTLFEEKLDGIADVQTTGLIALLAVTSTAVLDSMTSSYTIALAQITILMCISLGRIQLGLLSMVPNIVPFVALLGIMGALGIPLDTFTVLIGGIITGLIVDDTTHFFFQYKRNLEERGSTEEAIRATLQDVGVPLLTTTVVVIASFTVFTVSSMNNIKAFGLLMASGAFFALITDLLISPALLAILAKTRKTRTTRTQAASPAGMDGIPAAARMTETDHAH